MIYFLQLFEGITDIVGLGMPREVAQYFQQKGGKNAFLLAKWFKDYKSRTEDKDWFIRMRFSDDLVMYARTAEAIRKGGPLLDEVKRYYDLEDRHVSQENYDDIVRSLHRELDDDSFFNQPLIQDVMSKQLTDLSHLKKMTLAKAVDVYEQKRIFTDAKPVLEFDDGYRWVNVGKKSPMIAKLMKNCGSAGVMSMDRDRTIMVLFDEKNDPRVLCTYSPNEGYISGVERKAGKEEIEDEFVPKIIDLCDKLGASYRDTQPNLLAAYVLRNHHHTSKSLIDDFGKQWAVAVDLKDEKLIVYYGGAFIRDEKLEREVLNSQDFDDYVKGVDSDKDLSTLYKYLSCPRGKKHFKAEKISIYNFKKRYD